MDFIFWIGIVFCLIQSALFSGLTLGLFGLNRMELEIAVESGNKDALKLLEIRKDANLLLTTLLWGNVGINVLLTLLTDSLLMGISAFFFSTFCITIFGEILPQAYFSRHAFRLGIKLHERFDRGYEIISHRAANASVRKLHDVFFGAVGNGATFQDLSVDANIAKLIDNNCQAFSACILHQMADQSGFAAAQKSGDYSDGKFGEFSHDRPLKGECGRCSSCENVLVFHAKALAHRRHSDICSRHQG